MKVEEDEIKCYSPQFFFSSLSERYILYFPLGNLFVDRFFSSSVL